jgi:HD-GYP domain-containing protein (c-di-GMP phosphodiesterase class II)
MPASLFSALQFFSGSDWDSAPHDDGTAAHCARVGQGSALLASRLGLDREVVDLVGWAGTMHDIGKLRIPGEILHKMGPLTPEEWDVVRRHPGEGAAMLMTASPELGPIADGIRSHHEQWDGSGYPDGLHGDDIPLYGRIISVLDVYDSLTCPRPYRIRSWSEQDAVDYIKASSGSRFDPSVVPAFLELHERVVRLRRAG